MGPEAAHPREVVFELGELDLELSLGAVGVVGEDVEDHRGAVDHRDAERRLEVALLTRHELVVAGDEVRVLAADLILELSQLAPAQVAIGVRPLAPLGELAGSRYPRRPQQLLELGERILASAFRGDSDRERALAGAGVRHAGAARVPRRGASAVACPLHLLKCRSLRQRIGWASDVGAEQRAKPDCDATGWCIWFFGAEQRAKPDCDATGWCIWFFGAEQRAKPDCKA
jgi:hypothetical protein